MKEELRDKLFRANDEYSQALEELRQLVYERMGTPDKPREPTLETLEQLNSLVWQAKEAYDRTVRPYERLRNSEEREVNNRAFGPRLLSHRRAEAILARGEADFPSPETANGLGPEAQGIVGEQRTGRPTAGDWAVILGPTLLVWAIVAICYPKPLRDEALRAVISEGWWVEASLLLMGWGGAALLVYLLPKGLQRLREWWGVGGKEWRSG